MSVEQAKLRADFFRLDSECTDAEIDLFSYVFCDVNEAIDFGKLKLSHDRVCIARRKRDLALKKYLCSFGDVGAQLSFFGDDDDGMV